MKREFIALLVIAGILTGSIFNAHYVGSKTDELRGQLLVAQLYCGDNGREKTVPLAASALASWLEWRKYAHIMLRHSEVDSVTEAYYALLAELESDGDGVPTAAFGLVEQKLRCISDMEQLTLGSIL